MGRKLRGAALRAHKRGKAFANEMVDQEATQVEESQVVEKSNEELFVIDTKGDSKAVVPQQIKQNPTKKQAHKIKKQAKSSLPLLDQKKVEQLVEKHDAKKLQVMLKESEDKMRGDRRAVARNERKKKPGKYDLWGDDEEKDNSKSKKTKAISAKQSLKEDNARKEKVLQTGGVKGSHVALIAQPVSKKASDAVAVDVAHAGQSYRPDPKQYQEVVQDAVSLELRRQKAQEYNKAPLATGMSAETRALLVDDSSSEEEGDEEDINKETNVLHKRRDKLTRAQRNKQKRVKQERAIEDKQRKNKKLLNSVAEIPRFKKEMKKQVKESTEKKEKQEEARKRRKGTPGKNVLQKYAQKDPMHVPTLPVALEAEHQDSSLRTLKPKGSLLTDRMASMVDRDLVSKRKMGDKKRVVQGKRRKINVKGNRGHDIIKAMDGAILG